MAISEEYAKKRSIERLIKIASGYSGSKQVKFSKEQLKSRLRETTLNKLPYSLFNLTYLRSFTMKTFTHFIFIFCVLMYMVMYTSLMSFAYAQGTMTILESWAMFGVFVSLLSYYIFVCSITFEIKHTSQLIFHMFFHGLINCMFVMLSGKYAGLTFEYQVWWYLISTVIYMGILQPHVAKIIK